jgi:NADH dehydrogenase FAD-containing subunit
MNRKIEQTRIVIAGGGFAGLYAPKYFEKRLAGRKEVTLVSR